MRSSGVSLNKITAFAASPFTLFAFYPFRPPLIRIIPSQHDGQCLEHDFQIKPGGPVLYIKDVQPDHLFKMEPVPPAHLPQAGYPRPHVKSRPVPILVISHLVWDWRARADYAHL